MAAEGGDKSKGGATREFSQLNRELEVSSKHLIIISCYSLVNEQFKQENDDGWRRT